MQEYLHYMTEVLGIRSVLMPAEAPVAMPARLLFLEEVGRSTPESLELLGKMQEAMKLGADEAAYIELTPATVASELVRLEQAQVLVVFSKSLADYLTANFPHCTVVQSPSPLDMVKQAALKREAWDVLKHVMKILA